MDDELLNRILGDISTLKRSLQDNGTAKEWMSLNETSKYLGLSVRQLYRLISDNTIPFKVIPGTKKVRFRKRHLDLWIETGKNVNTDVIPVKAIKDINKFDS